MGNLSNKERKRREKLLQGVDILKLERETAAENENRIRVTPGICIRNLFDIRKEEILVEKHETELNKYVDNPRTRLYSCKWRNVPVSVKEIPVEWIRDQENFDEFESTRNIFGSISHPNIRRFYGNYFEEPRVGLVCEFMDKNLRIFLEENTGKVSISQKLEIIYKIAMGLEYMSNRDVCLINFGINDIMIGEGNNPVIDSISFTKVHFNNYSRSNQSIVPLEKYEKYHSPQLLRKHREIKEELIASEFSENMFHIFGIIILEIMTENFYDKLMKRFTPTEKRFCDSIGLKWLWMIQEKCCDGTKKKDECGKGRESRHFFEKIVAEIKVEMENSDDDYEYDKILFFESMLRHDDDELQRIRDLMSREQFICDHIVIQFGKEKFKVPIFLFQSIEKKTT